jgi:hypothetical protein
MIGLEGQRRWCNCGNWPWQIDTDDQSQRSRLRMALEWKTLMLGAFKFG